MWDCLPQNSTQTQKQGARTVVMESHPTGQAGTGRKETKARSEGSGGTRGLRAPQGASPRLDMETYLPVLGKGC